MAKFKLNPLNGTSTRIAGDAHFEQVMEKCKSGRGLMNLICLSSTNYGGTELLKSQIA